MFLAIISTILRSTRLPAGSIAGALYHKLETQSSAPEDGRNYRPKHVELIVIINKIWYCCIQLAVYMIVFYNKLCQMQITIHRTVS